MTQTLIPNLFIVGAPKCGTSAFAEEYLNTHPGIFMSALKEPHFFNTDHPNHRITREWDDYLRLFSAARPEQRWRGEGSVWYLYSRAAIPSIHAINPQARLIVFLRNPVEMAQSLHAQLIHSTDENVFDFDKAWALQAARRHGHHLPRNCRTPEHLQYCDACSLGAQLQRVYEVFPCEQVKLVFLDDVMANVRQAYLDVLDFLGLPDDGRQDFPVVNANKQRRFFWLAERLKKPSPLMNKVWRAGTRLLGRHEWLAHRMLVRLDELTTRVAPRRHVSAATRLMLERAFADDIALLERLSGRDLSHWIPHVRSEEPHP